MEWIASCFVLVTMAYGGGGVTKRSGIEQFWTDDYKIFEQVYGKTSDKHIYGDTLPRTEIYTNKRKEAAEKNERYLLKNINDPDPDPEEYEPYSWEDKYNSLVSKPLQIKKKPTGSTINFISYLDLKPISHASDPDTYNYLKHLEEYTKEENHNFPLNMADYRPLKTVDLKPENSDNYKSIQEILDAHEANSDTNFDEESDRYKYPRYPKKKKKDTANLCNERVQSKSQNRCASGRCRKRAAFRSRNNYRPLGLKIVSIV